MPSILARSQQAFVQRAQRLLAGHREEGQEPGPSSGAMNLCPFSLLDISDLPNGHEECGICQEPYLSATNVETPAQLSCGHIFGIRCVRTWLYSGPEPRCPMCRAYIVDPNKVYGSEVFLNSTSFMERLALAPGSSERMVVLNEAQKQTSKRINDARRRGLIHSNADENDSSMFIEGVNPETPRTTAAQVLAFYLTLMFADMHVSQPLDWDQWRLLKNHIEQVRRRVVDNGSNTGTLCNHQGPDFEGWSGSMWDHRGPGLLALLNPLMRPLIENFLRKMVLLERERETADRSLPA